MGEKKAKKREGWQPCSSHYSCERMPDISRGECIYTNGYCRIRTKLQGRTQYNVVSMAYNSDKQEIVYWEKLTLA